MTFNHVLYNNIEGELYTKKDTIII